MNRTDIQKEKQEGEHEERRNKVEEAQGRGPQILLAKMLSLMVRVHPKGFVEAVGSRITISSPPGLVLL